MHCGDKPWLRSPCAWANEITGPLLNPQTELKLKHTHTHKKNHHIPQKSGSKAIPLYDIIKHRRIVDLHVGKLGCPSAHLPCYPLLVTHPHTVLRPLFVPSQICQGTGQGHDTCRREEDPVRFAWAPGMICWLDWAQVGWKGEKRVHPETIKQKRHHIIWDQLCIVDKVNVYLVWFQHDVETSKCILGFASSFNPS